MKLPTIKRNCIAFKPQNQANLDISQDEVKEVVDVSFEQQKAVIVKKKGRGALIT
jgi:hypothetical protein